MWNVSVWLGDIEPYSSGFRQTSPEAATCKRSRDEAAQATDFSPAKRRRLASMDGNIRRMAGRTPSPRKGKGRTNVEERDMDPWGEDDGKTPRQTRTRSHGTVGNSVKETTVDATSRLDERFTFHHPLLDRIGTSSMPSRSSASNASGKTSRSRSPVKDSVDLHMSDIPINMRMREEVDIPPCVASLCTRLGDIAEGDGLMSQEIADQMKHHRDTKVRPRHIATTEELSPGSDLDDFKRLVKVWKDAKLAEKDNAHEAAWNCEVHSPIFRLALEPYEERLRHFNITHARPVPTFIPTRATRISQSKLVDYSINIMPTVDEERAIERLISNEDDMQSTITQTKYTAVRTRPCVISIETKVNSSSMEAKNQLAFWAAAHFARLRTMFGPFPEEEKEEELGSLCVHPVIHVQLHEWKLYLVVLRQGGKFIDEIDLDLCIGGTRNLLELWKLRASLRCLAEWGNEKYWPDLWRKIEDAGRVT